MMYKSFTEADLLFYKAYDYQYKRFANFYGLS